MQPSRQAFVFVAIVYAMLAAAFVWPLVELFGEFGPEPGFSLAVFEPNHFVFFPLFGLLVLIAFFLPSAVFVDLYWRSFVNHGPVRFWGWLIVIAVGSFFVGQMMVAAGPRAIWELSPAKLAVDKGEACRAPAGPCTRAPLLDTVLEVRKAGMSRIGLAQFSRDCRPDPLLETPKTHTELRHCFVARDNIDAAGCCRAQQRFGNALDRAFVAPADRSRTFNAHARVMPLKVFFLAIVLVIGILLAWRRDQIDHHYQPLVKPIERGILVGAVAMLAWPLTFFASVQSTAVLHGWASSYEAVTPVLLWGAKLTIDPALRRNIALGYGVALVPWALLLLFYFFGRKGTEVVARVAGVAASFVAMLRHEELIDYSTRILGAGAHASNVFVAVLVVAGGMMFLFVMGWTADRPGIAAWQERRAERRRAMGAADSELPAGPASADSSSRTPRGTRIDT